LTYQDDATRIRHILDHAREAAAMVQGRRRADLDNDRQLSLALVRLLEIVGEAASRVSDERKALYPRIPWSEIVGLRNRLIHAYDKVDHGILWQILDKDVPALIRDLGGGEAGVD